jgi:hypothetical protein
MAHQQHQGAQLGAPSQVERDTGLDPHQQRERETIVRLWAWRLAWLEATTGCTLADAIRATEDADRG